MAKEIIRYVAGAIYDSAEVIKEIASGGAEIVSEGIKEIKKIYFTLTAKEVDSLFPIDNDYKYMFSDEKYNYYWNRYAVKGKYVKVKKALDF